MAPRKFIFFLKWAAQFHADLQDFYQNRSKEALSPEVEYLLHYLSGHEASLSRIIEAYEFDAPPAILEAWFKVSPDLRAVHFPEDYEFAPNATVDEVIQKAMAIDESLIAMYQMLMRQTESEHLREVLEDMVADERREEMRLLNSQY